MTDLQPLTTPFFATVSITESCNMRCAHCYGYFAPSVLRKMEYERFTSLVDAFEGLGTLSITITGGEPLMHPDFLRMAEYLRGKQVAWSLFTNGALITDRVADEIADCRPAWLQVSIDGGTDEAYRAIRRWPLARVQEGVRRATDRGIRVFVNSVLHRRNASRPEIESLRAFCADAGVRGLSYTFLEPIGRAYGLYKELAPDPDQYEEAAHAYPDLVAHARPPNGTADSTALARSAGGYVHGCSPGMTDIVVSVDGQLGPCMYYLATPLFRRVHGLRAGPIVEAWQESPAFRYVRANASAYRCRMQNQCPLYAEGLCIRCQAMSFQHFGDPQAPHPWCVLHSAEIGLSVSAYMIRLNRQLERNDASGRSSP